MSKENTLLCRIDDYVLEKFTRSTPQATNTFATHSYAAATALLGSAALVSTGPLTAMVAAGFASYSGLSAFRQHNISRLESMRDQSPSYSRTDTGRYVQAVLLGTSIGLGVDTVSHVVLGDQPMYEVLHHAQLASGFGACVGGLYSSTARQKQLHAPPEGRE